MYPVKVKDYTRLGGWLAALTVWCALHGVNNLLSWLMNWEQNAYAWAPLPLIGTCLSCAVLVAFGLLLAKKSAARYVFLAATGAEGLLVFLIFMSSAMLGVPYYALTGTISILLWHVVFCVTGGVYLFRSRRAAVYFGEAQPCGTSAAALRLTARSLPLVRPVSRRKAMARRARHRRTAPALSRHRRTAHPHSPLCRRQPQMCRSRFTSRRPCKAPHSPPRRRRPRLPRSRRRPAGRAAGHALPVQHAPAGGMVCPACGMQGLPGASFCTVCGARLVPAAQAGLAQGRAQTKEGEPHV